MTEETAAGPNSPASPGANPIPPELRDDGDAGPGGLSSGAKSALEWAAVIIGALVVALVVKTFLVQAFYIPSESMIPTLQVGDRVLVNKYDDDIGKLDRGDIIVFDRPGGSGADGISELIKRVVAFPGETVEGRDGRVYVDGVALREGYLERGAQTGDFGPQTVPEGEIWVMGDNRGASDDSRRFGTIPEDDVVGTAFVIIWPISELGFL